MLTKCMALLAALAPHLLASSVCADGKTECPYAMYCCNCKTHVSSTTFWTDDGAVIPRGTPMTAQCQCCA